MALSFHLLLRTSEIWAPASAGTDFCILFSGVRFFRGSHLLQLHQRADVTMVTLLLRGSKTDRTHEGHLLSLLRVSPSPLDFLQVLLDLFDALPQHLLHACTALPLMTVPCARNGHKTITSNEASAFVKELQLPQRTSQRLERCGTSATGAAEVSAAEMRCCCAMLGLV